MKSTPILFSAPMVRALLDGNKTQTRRIVEVKNMLIRGEDGVLYDADCINPGVPIKCRYGTAGDHLWVKETWQPEFVSGWEQFGPVRYRATNDERVMGSKWRPSIFMPYWASRITLELTCVRVEQLQEISDDDAEAEGVPFDPKEFGRAYPWNGEQTPRGGYRRLWDEINGLGSWSANPWVWVLTFKRILP